MANGMASLMVGTSGLKSAQTALNTTAHNIANINNVGYTRQQIIFKDTQYVSYGNSSKSPVSSTYGLGVSVNEIRRIRDEFIDKAYRVENSRLGFYESQYKSIEEIEDLFGEMQGVTFQESMNNLYDAINELSKEPASTVKRSSLMQNASAFMTRADAVYNGLKAYQSTLNVQVYNMVDTINKLGNKIYDLNKQIAKIESTGVEAANDLRDQRDSALDELSKYMSISYFEKENGEVIVTAESVPFVTITSVSEMSYRVTEGNNLYIPTFPAYERDVYPDLVNLDNTNDRGELKGLLLARGSVEVDYTDVPVKPDAQVYDMNDPEQRLAYNRDCAIYEEKQKFYNDYIEPSAILSALAGLDKLVNGVTTRLNEVLCPSKELVRTGAEGPIVTATGTSLIPESYEYSDTSAVLYDKKGNVYNGYTEDGVNYLYKSTEVLYKDEECSAGQEASVSRYNYVVLDQEATDYGNDVDRSIGHGIFSRSNTSDYVVIKDANNNDVYVKNNNDYRNDRSDYTLGNIELNHDVLADVSKLPFTTKQGKEDIARAEALVDVWNSDFASLNPDRYAVGSFSTYYNNYIGEYATTGKVIGNYVDHQKTMVTGYDNQRLQSEGVASDEELEKMIKFQQAYNASSRYINVISEMLEHLVTSLGHV